MAKITVPGSARKCALCRYWSGGNAVTRSMNRGYWDIETSVRGKCDYQRGANKLSHDVACPRFKKDDYRYPDI